MTAPLFYVSELSAGSVRITGDAARHAAGSMRLRIGEFVLVCDGRGTFASGEVLEVRGRDEVVVGVEQLQHEPPPRELRVVQAVPKGDRGELAVQLLTETGASRIVPWASARTVADWRGKESAKRERWRRVAEAAAKQSRRRYLPVVEDVVRGVPAAGPGTLVLHEQAQTSLFEVELAAGPVSVVVGPEGGLTDDEVAAMTAAGAQAVRLGDQILRTSTAGAAACVWLRGIESRFGT